MIEKLIGMFAMTVVLMLFFAIPMLIISWIMVHFPVVGVILLAVSFAGAFQIMKEVEE